MSEDWSYAVTAVPMARIPQADLDAMRERIRTLEAVVKANRDEMADLVARAHSGDPTPSGGVWVDAQRFLAECAADAYERGKEQDREMFERIATALRARPSIPGLDAALDEMAAALCVPTHSGDPTPSGVDYEAANDAALELVAFVKREADPDLLGLDSKAHYNFLRDLFNHHAFHTADCSANVARLGCSCGGYASTHPAPQVREGLFWCNKCGYTGTTTLHADCSYNAVLLAAPTPAPISLTQHDAAPYDGPTVEVRVGTHRPYPTMPQGCHRSHPHELMSPECERLAEIAKERNANPNPKRTTRRKP